MRPAGVTEQAEHTVHAELALVNVTPGMDVPAPTGAIRAGDHNGENGETVEDWQAAARRAGADEGPKTGLTGRRCRVEMLRALYPVLPEEVEVVDDVEQGVCPICLEPAERDAAITSCGHIFHPQCCKDSERSALLQECLWNCPTCRAAVTAVRVSIIEEDDSVASFCQTGEPAEGSLSLAEIRQIVPARHLAGHISSLLGATPFLLGMRRDPREPHTLDDGAPARESSDVALERAPSQLAYDIPAAPAAAAGLPGLQVSEPDEPDATLGAEGAGDGEPPERPPAGDGFSGRVRGTPAKAGGEFALVARAGPNGVAFPHNRALWAQRRRSAPRRPAQPRRVRAPAVARRRGARPGTR
jgi:hypothetical protein